MRPVPTWKSTEAAPTPTKEGAIDAPSALSPWHEEQPFRKICFPSSMEAERAKTFSVSVTVALATEKVVPIPSKAIMRSNGPAALCRR